MPNSGYFDVKRDIAIEKAGGFWCHACLVSHPAREQSPDPCYCQGCYDFLLKEAETLTGHIKKPEWLPEASSKTAKTASPVSQYGGEIMSTLENPKNEVDIIHPSVATRTLGKRGPKHKKLPEDLIGQLSAEGMGPKAIASKLKRELGIDVSYKTIQRLLSGERKQLRPLITEHG